LRTCWKFLIDPDEKRCGAVAQVAHQDRALADNGHDTFDNRCSSWVSNG
jgi:hypothetical protein